MSSIYKWLKAEFGGGGQGVVRHMLVYAKGNLARELKGYQGRLKFDYDWNLNE